MSGDADLITAQELNHEKESF